MCSSTKPSTIIDDLPPEMISKLFEHLHPKDLAACSLVNKRWHSIYSNFKLQNLVVTDYNPDYELKWYHSNQLVQEAERCLPVMFRVLLEKPLLSNLKNLALYLYNFQFDFNKLNRFRHLVHLQIECTCFNQKKMHLNLPKLKAFRFNSWSDDNPLFIDCPELRTLAYLGKYKHRPNRLDVKHPETIRKLVTSLLGPQLPPFKSVEYLVTEDFEAINKSILLSLPRLRELRYDLNIEELVQFEFDNEVGGVDRMKRALSEFVKEARKLRGRDFRFTFSGFELTNVNVEKIDFGVQVNTEIGFETVSNEYVYMKNYHLIEPGALPFVDFVDFNLLLSNVTGAFPRCFSQKFTRIYVVYTTTQVQDPDQFLWFLKSLKFLKSLELKETGLGQKFYDQLPESVSSLSELRLRDGHCENELQLNFDFIDSLSCLSHLEIYSNLFLESLPSLVGWLGRLKGGEFKVRLREEEFNIEKGSYSTKWNIKRASSLLFETENAGEIVNFFEGQETPEIGTASG